MISISTKTGDRGQTGLANSQRVDKDSPIIEAVGAVDELNSWLGLIIATTHGDQDFKQHRRFLLNVQQQLLVIGSELAQSPRPQLQKSDLKHLESTANQLQQSLADRWHTKFLYPGGSPLAARFDIARTVCRRAERRLVELNRHQSLSPLLIKYLNRLSDYLYILRCWANSVADLKEIEFKPTK